MNGPTKPRAKGDVWGARLWAGPWGEVLTAEAELNFSSVEYENNSNDADDKAWRVALEGQTGAYTYNAGYEYIGPDYNVAANDSFENDRQGYNIAAGAIGPIIHWPPTSANTRTMWTPTRTRPKPTASTQGSTTPTTAWNAGL